MLPLVLIFLLVHLIGQITCQGGIVFPVDATDGDLCTLTNGGVGQCQKFSECGKKFADTKTKCGFSGKEPIVCCDVVHRQCAAIVPVSKISGNFNFHLVGVVDLAEVGEFPFMALIEYKKSGSEDEDVSHVRCGAAVVSKRYLLTAAHCIKNNTDLVPYSIKLGTTEASDAGAPSYLIDSVYWHEESKKRQNDIGILKLKKDIILNSHIQPICLYTDPEDLPESANLTVMGWGQGNNDQLSTVLLKGTVRPVPRTICQARFDVGLAKRIQLKETHLCALGDQNEHGTATDACLGDSGGPMVLKEGDKHYLVAIVSTGQGCGSNFYAGIYTRVNKFVSWIIAKGVFENL